MGKHARPRTSRVPAAPVIAFAVAIVLAGVGVAVVRSVSSGAPSQRADGSGGGAAQGIVAEATGVPATPTSPSSPGDTTTSPDDATPTPTPVASPSVPSGTAFLTAGADGGLAITPAQAETVTLGLWAIRWRAIDAGDVNTLKRVESGVALTGDLNDIAQIPDDPACDCLDDWMLEPTSAAAIVPRNLSYPASFVGEVATTDDEDGGGNVDVMVVTRDDAASPWSITLASGYGIFSGDTRSFGVTGWSVSNGDTTTLDGKLASLADVWQRAKAGNTGGSGGFDPASWLVSDRLDDLAAHRQDTPQANGLRAHFTFALDPSVRPIVVGFKDGAIVCGAIRQTATYTPAPGHAMVQHAKQMDFGMTVAPGRYSAVAVTADWQTCVGHTRAGLTVPIGYDASLDGDIIATPANGALPADPAQVSTPFAWSVLLDGGSAGFDSFDGGSDGDGGPGGSNV